MIDSATAIDAAQSLILELKAPAPYHAVWVQQQIDEAGLATGDHHICVSIRPGHEALIHVPEAHGGVSVVNVPWPEDAA